MAVKNRITLKSYFETGDKPTEGQFIDLIDSFLSLVDPDINSTIIKNTPVNADVLLIEDSAAGFAKKKVTIGSLPGGGVSAFTGLTDTPANYTSASNKIVKVNNGETALEYSPLTIDASGNLLNAGSYLFYRVATGTNFIGTNTIPGDSSGNNCTFVGNASGLAHTTGPANTGVGALSLNTLTTGIANTAVGLNAGRVITTQDYNVYIGWQSGYSNTGETVTALGINTGYTGNGSNTLFLGAYAGYYSTESNIMLIANQQYASAAVEKTNSLVYGQFHATPASALFRINAVLELTQTKSGATQVAAGAGANEPWYTVSHATLPDYVVIMGV